MSSSDTFLESFLDGIANLPYEVKRNLDLIKTLDKKFIKVSVALQEAEDAYIAKTQRTILNFPLPDYNDEMSVVVPTTEELRAFVNDPETMKKISALRKEALQLTDEKMLVASQTRAIIECTLKKVNGDLVEYEKFLHGTGEFSALVAPPPVATPAVIKNERTLKAPSVINASSAMKSLQQRVMKPNDLCAMRVSPNQMADTEWILGRVISYSSESGLYQIADEDPEAALETKKVSLAPSQVKPSGTGLDKLQKGETVMAVYPETTSFYHAIVTQLPRKVANATYVHVQFKDDSDEFGVTHEKMILTQHIMRLN